MKIIKPLRLGVLHRPWRWLGQDHLGVSVLALADMGPEPRLRPEPELWQLAARELADGGGLLDLAIPKACAEFLATGYAYTRHQRQKNACLVKIQVGELEKSLAAFGDRFLVNGRPTEPLPFAQLRLDWENAFGGENNADNPRGLGAHPVERNGALCHPLANIEPAGRGYRALSRGITPDCFGPLDFCLPGHFSRIGKKYDKQWQEQDYPGFARDIDWHIFNRAGRDQWWPRSPSLPPKAPWRIWNMHPECPLQQGVLPDWRARCFITRASVGAPVPGSSCSAQPPPGPTASDDCQPAAHPALEEITLRATTVWFFPHLEQMVLIWQGSCAINEDDALDIGNMLVAVEAEGESRPLAHYQDVFQARSQKATGAAYALREQDLVTESLIGPWLDTAPCAPESALAANLARREAGLREEYWKTLGQEAQDAGNPQAMAWQKSAPGLDIAGENNGGRIFLPEEDNAGHLDTPGKVSAPGQDIWGGESAARLDIQGQATGPRPGELPEYIARVERQAAALQRRALKKAAALGAQLPGLHDAGIETNHRAINALGVATGASGPHSVGTMAGHRAPYCAGPTQYHRMLTLLQRRDESLPNAHGDNLPDARDERFANAQDEELPDARAASDTTALSLALHQMYRMSADTRPPAPPLSAGETDVLRRRLHSMLERTRDLGGMDLTGADLRGLDLRGVNLRQALLESARLDNCLLDGADLSEAMLAHSSLVNTSLRDARLSETCLTGAHCQGTEFSGAHLSGALLTRATFADCCFARAHLSGLLFYLTALNRCSFSGATLENSTFLGQDAAGLDFSHSRLEKVTFNNGRLRDARFNAARLANCSFITMALDAAQFQDALLDSCVFTAGTHARSALFQRARLISCNLRQTPLERTDFSRVQAESCDFSGAILADARLDGINAGGCLFIRADLTHASLNHAELIGALLQKCRLAGADLRAANLFRADLSQSTLDDHTRLQGAYTHQCKTLPRRSRETP